jgi:hypothetical protein
MCNYTQLIQSTKIHRKHHHYKRFKLHVLKIDDGQLEVAAKITLSEYTYNNFFIDSLEEKEAQEEKQKARIEEP